MAKKKRTVSGRKPIMVHHEWGKLKEVVVGFYSSPLAFVHRKRLAKSLDSRDERASRFDACVGCLGVAEHGHEGCVTSLVDQTILWTEQVREPFSGGHHV